MVGTTGFEPATSSSQSWRSSQAELRSGQKVNIIHQTHRRRNKFRAFFFSSMISRNSRTTNPAEKHTTSIKTKQNKRSKKTASKENDEKSKLHLFAIRHRRLPTFSGRHPIPMLPIVKIETRPVFQRRIKQLPQSLRTHMPIRKQNIHLPRMTPSEFWRKKIKIKTNRIKTTRNRKRITKTPLTKPRSIRLSNHARRRNHRRLPKPSMIKPTKPIRRTT